jgi:mannose-1-phosphate guanylyltransferase
VDAIVLVGGLGTRLRPLTATRHKSLVPLCNRPYMEYLFDWLERSGFNRTVLALGQHNEDLAEAYPPGRRGRMDITIVTERERLESGGAIRHAVRSAGVSGRFAVVNGDVYVDFGFPPALAAHKAAGAELTLALYEMPDPSQFGVAVVDDNGMVTGFVEKPPPGVVASNLVNAGVWIFEPGLVDEIPAGAVRVEETLFPSLVAQRRRVLGYQFKGLWADIGTWQRYLAINRALLPQGSNAIAESAVVAGAARVAGSSVGEGSSLAAGSVVIDSILWERVTAGAGAVIKNSVVADGVRIGDGARIDGAVIGRGAIVDAGATVLPGTSIEVGGRYHAEHDR